MVTGTRQTAEVRREAVLRAAQYEFAEKGYHGASTEAIARRAGISQPYLFRLFGSKKELFVANTERCFRETLEAFNQAAAGRTGEEALKAIGERYMEMLADRTMLLGQMQAYAACDDQEICDAVRRGYGNLFVLVELVSGLPAEALADFFARGMLLNVFAAMNLLESDEEWAQRLLWGCRQGAE